ncbi:hypothetical protein P171DRAFT_459255 [Karstenula rhodostoma CBS 690.94]|uniref:ubiquitinyl hydrolase 1 n=1 Tax=Karstenula rhodostoma CBS 690.94 TaxID=1392251 RepID=A0A9P4U519_9PLEO|nr:hypothetical protein P171DRAFT_459255 [Karstenula rhodostoma CBS 690.94]
MHDGQTTAIKVSAQNAAVLITREKTQLVFETFELSADNKSVQSARGRLVRDFPANAIAIDSALLLEADFSNILTKTLSTMSQQKVPEMQAHSKKTGAAHEEDRDTSRPAVVSEMFLGMLRGIGTPRYTTSVRKNTREEVFHSGARKPWRRSAMWLLVRVALQLTISRSPDGSLALYKNAIVLTMCRLLSSSHQFELPSELMHFMNAKIDRRRQKLLHVDSLLDSVAARADSVLRTTYDIISQRWTLVQVRDSQIESMAALSRLEMSAETLIALPDLDRYIASVQSRQGSQETDHYQPMSGLLRPRSGPGEAQPLPSPYDKYAMQNLQLFEQWVSRELSRWQLIAQSDPLAVCRDVCQLIKRYHTVASKVYSENPEGLSVMLLTIMELWTACDEAATGTCELLREFSAGMSPAVIHNLLLPFLNQMKRLSKVETHLASRAQGHPNTSIFSLDSSQGFPNRFYNSSQKHKDLHQAILDQAETARQVKLTELANAKVEYNRLNKLHLDAECEYITKIIDRWCDPPEKCAYRRQRDALGIQIHEWPLPKETNRANAVVFELAVPAWFVHWRDARFYILHSARTPYYLSSDPHLTRYYTSINHRIELLSETKPAIVTHYKKKDIPSATESNVCVPSGLNYQYHDADSRSYLGSGFVSDEEMPLACTYRLPGEAKAFQRFILRTESAPDGEAPNAVMASQDACPTNAALEDYKELASIPLGRHIQWLNVLLQLAMPNVDFKKLETTLVILQCIYQTGPQSRDNDLLRESHYVLQHDTYAAAIMSNLNTALDRVKENWESVNALSAFIAIAARVLSLNQSARGSCFAFLQAARYVAAEWLSDLREKAYLAMNNHANRTQFVSKSLEVALLCISTFDIDDQYLDTVMRSPDAHLLIWASIAVQESGNNRALNEPHVARLQLRSKRLLLRSYAVLSQNGVALDAAVKKVWSGYMFSSIGWSTQAKHWITTDTATGARVHYNLLSGELLVNGLPLNQPPANYRESSLFRMLFGDATVEVMPASKPGFQFSTKRSFGGCAIDLGMESGHLISKYPHHFSKDYVLWYNFVDEDVKFLPKEDPWNFDHSSQWILGGIRVISTVSKSARPGDTLLHAEIPLLRLSFSLKKGAQLLNSREHRSMFIDEDHGDRIALILESDLRYSNKGFHVEVHVVKVDSSLRRLLDSHDLDCKLFLAYLHALTQLSQANVKMLSKIARLSPGRQFYPAHIRVMQSVQWDKDLPFISQHDDFHMIKLQITHRKDIDEHLGARASMRSSISHDEIYQPRDKGLQSNRATNVATIHWDAAQTSALWSLMSGQKIIHGAQTGFDLSLFRFDAPMMEEKVIGSILAKLPALHQLFKDPQTLENFASDAHMGQLQLIAMFAKSGQLALAQAPDAASNIEKILNENLRAWNGSPEWSITRQPNEKKRDYDRRCRNAWTRAKNSMWPCATAVNPQVTNEEFNAWYDNSLLYNYLSQLFQVLERLPISRINIPATLQCNPAADLFLMPAPTLPCKPEPMLASEDQSTGFTHTYSGPRLKALVEKMRSTGTQSNLEALMLKQTAGVKNPNECRNYVKSYNISHSPPVTALQRAACLIKLAKSGRNEDLNLFQFPETLLIEAESGIIVRQVQEQIAGEIQQPLSGRNAVMQLNIGEGKSSVIVPILVRVIIAKPQSKQIAQMLISKLGGLVNHQPNYTDIDAISAILVDCISQGGILLMQPEHILSFKPDIAKSAIASQGFLERYSRNIVDESTQRLIKSSPELARCTIPAIAENFPCSIKTVPGIPSAFPRTRLLRDNAADFFIQSLATKICSEGLLGFPISRQPPAIREAVLTYITKSNLSPQEINLVENSATLWTETNQPQLLLLRGLFANRVVNYGLADRTPPTKVTVPFQAKDTPVLRSEFSHPDVIITLTLLSYYYQGLNNSKLFAALTHLSNSDQAEITLAEAFTTLKGINMKDQPHYISKVFPALRSAKSVINYYVSHIIFPKEIKEFPNKLSASSWDIGKSQEQLTTGFSGTINSRHVLPLDVAYLELPDQKHTNALVIEYLLQPENRVHLIVPTSVDQSVSDADRLLSCVMQLHPPVQLKFHNNSKEAVVFIDRNDEICVVDREGRVDLLLASSYQSRLNTCLVFLDEAHTRGIDLVLPLEYRAVVTLGPRLTKDRLVQAYIRMRKLGKSQTVIFCVSQEIQTKILKASQKTNASTITVADILEWSMHETLDDLRRNMPLWASATKKQDGQSQLTKDDAKKLLETKAQSLKDQYQPHLSLDGPKIFAISEDPVVQQIATRCEAFNITQFKASALQEEQERELSPEMEQERQIQRAPSAKPRQHELHQDVQNFALTGKVVSSSRGYGPAFSTLLNMSTATIFNPSNLSCAKTLLATTDFAETVVKDSKTFVSDAFLRSVQWVLTSHDSNSNINAAMIISPYEANRLVRSMEKSKVTTLHLYRARINSGYPSLDALSFYTTPDRQPALHFPRHLAGQLNLFAGQLYFKSHDDYLETCRFLGLFPQSLSEELEKQGWKVDAAGFILSDDRARVGGESGLTKSPISFLRSLFTARRNGHGLGKSHIGKLLEGHVFLKEDFDV